MGADQPRRHFFTRWGGGDHGRDVVVVAVGFIDEALAVAQHTDDARFAALDDVREVSRAAVAVRHLRNRCPGDGGRHVAIDPGTGTFAQAQAIAANAEGRQGQMLMPGRCAGEQGLAAVDVIGETTRGEHHGLACMDAHRAFGGVDHRASYLVILAQQSAHGR
ncbi:hypothetical protein D3C71_1403230 [compost metagenome]